MLEPARSYTMKVKQDIRVGLVLGLGDDEVLLPRREVPEGALVGDELHVFLYVDGEDRLSATLARPRAELGDFAALQVADVTDHGVFLDWGIDKDLFLPFSELVEPLHPGNRVVVRVGLCARGRPVATARLGRHFERDLRSLSVGDEVDLLVLRFIEHGALVLVEGRFEGMIHRDEQHRRLAPGTALRGYIKDLRPDGRVEVRLRPIGRDGAAAAEQAVLEALEHGGGHLDLHDKSPPELIQQRLRLSKKAFKQAVGALYRQGQIRLVQGGIERVDP